MKNLLLTNHLPHGWKAATGITRLKARKIIGVLTLELFRYPGGFYYRCLSAGIPLTELEADRLPEACLEAENRFHRKVGERQQYHEQAQSEPRVEHVSIPAEAFQHLYAAFIQADLLIRYFSRLDLAVTRALIACMRERIAELNKIKPDWRLSDDEAEELFLTASTVTSPATPSTPNG